MDTKPVVYFYVPEGYNPATQYYVDIIKDSFRQKGCECVDATRLSYIPRHASIATIRPLEFLTSTLLKAPAKTLTWFQGITPEEIRMMFRPSLKLSAKIRLHTLAERFCLKRTGLAMFVSRRMAEHYREKYGVAPKRSLVMPCFNCALDEQLIRKNAHRYETPSFVYAGNMAPWQCIDDTLELFKKIKAQIPGSTLTIYTGDKAEACRKLNEHGVEAVVEFRPLDELPAALAKHKYGLIVRDDIAVNNVATPTKMNSYMAAGLIPVYSDVVDAYKENLSGCEYTVPFADINDCVRRIKDFERTQVDVERLIGSFSLIFDRYWNRDIYLTELAKRFE